MHKHLVSAGALALGLVASAATAGAQNMGAARAFSLGIAAGATVPVGDFADLYGTGFNIMGSLGFQPALMPVGVRIDAMYHSLPGEEIAGGLEVDDANIIAGTANAVLTVSNTGGVRPYLIGGLGVYRTDGGGEASTDFGLNAGGGLEFGLAGFSTFVEARYHSVFAGDDDADVGNLNLIPIVFGLRF